MYNRALVIAPVVTGVAIVIVLILISNISKATVALPLTVEGMLKKAEALPETKAFQEKYPNNSFTAGNSTSDEGDGFVKFKIGNWAVQYRTRHGSDRFDNILELMSRSTGQMERLWKHHFNALPDFITRSSVGVSFRNQIQTSHSI